MAYRLLKTFALLAVMVAAGIGLGAGERVLAGGGCRGVPPTAAIGDQVSMTGQACFTPTVLYAEPGATVTWTNESTDVHDVAGAPSGWGDYSEIEAGETTSYRFDAPGTYPYYCFVHPGMTGVIVVGDGKATAGAVRQSVREVVMPVSQSSNAGAAEPAKPLTQAATAAIVPEGDAGEDSPLLFALLGGVIGAVVVGLGVGARQLRR